MPRTIPECPRCRRSMEEGYLLERARNSDGRTHWVEGTPVRSFWSGVRLKGKRRLPASTFRCGSCGYLESYAWEE